MNMKAVALATEAVKGMASEQVLSEAEIEQRDIAEIYAGLKADLILLAMGFVGARKGGMLDQAGVEYDARGNVLADTQSYATSEDKIWACGDMRRGQSLVVWAIREGRQCARAVDEALMGATDLPR